MTNAWQPTTIVAAATPPGDGGLAVVRVSGPKAFAVARRVFLPAAGTIDFEPRRAVYGILHHPCHDVSESPTAGSPIDEVLVLPFQAPHSYSGEDTVEIFCHGGRVVTGAVVAACREAGAEPAVAGEFTRRAFLNGRLSLDQAEAVADLIHAPSEHAARAAMRQLLGGLDQQLAAVEKPLLDLLAGLEGSLEFMSEEEVEVPRAEVVHVLAAAIGRLDQLVAMAPAGRLLRDGIQVVLTGPPNAGKSSLFNALLESERAIVDAEPGTTRDVVSGRLTRGGSVYVLHDTAGVRTDPGRVEKIGIDHAWRQVSAADIVLLLSESGAPADEAAIALVSDGARPVIRVDTKRDLSPAAAVRPGHVAVSATSGEGMDRLWHAIEAAVAGFQLEEAVALGVVLNERHLHKLSMCRGDLEALRREVENNDPGDEIVGTLLASILSGLGEVSGRVFSEYVLDHVFARFCVGK